MTHATMTIVTTMPMMMQMTMAAMMPPAIAAVLDATLQSEDVEPVPQKRCDVIAFKNVLDNVYVSFT